MNKNNETGFRPRRNRNQQSDIENRNTGHSENRPYAGLSPNYESNYRPGEYDSYPDRDQRSQNRFGEEKNRHAQDRNSDDGRGRQDRGWEDTWNDGSYNARYRNESGSSSDESSPFRFKPDQNIHRGKGPKGYIRSDERITEEVNEKLTEDGYINASEIEVEVHHGDVVLTGSVESRQEKRRAEDIIDRISGVKDVENRLKLSPKNYKPDSGQYTNGFKERNGGLEYGPGAISGMGNTSATGDFNTAR